MLTYQDCLDYTDLTPEEVAFLAWHYGCTDIVAMEHGHDLMDSDTGLDTFEQMILDDLDGCYAHDDPHHARMLAALLEHFHADHPRH